MTLAQALIFSGFAICMICAAINDVRKFQIADAWSIMIIMLYIGFALIAPPASVMSHAAAPLLVFAGGAGLFAIGWLGGGDVKLVASVATWTGLEGLPHLLVGTALSGGALALMLICLRARPFAKRGRPRFTADTPVPYAVAIAGGAAFWASNVLG